MCIFHYILCKYFHIATVNEKSGHKCKRRGKASEKKRLRHLGLYSAVLMKGLYIALHCASGR